MNSVMAEGGKIRGCNGSSKWWAESLPPVVIELTDLLKIAPSGITGICSSYWMHISCDRVVRDFEREAKTRCDF